MSPSYQGRYGGKAATRTGQRCAATYAYGKHAGERCRNAGVFRDGEEWFCAYHWNRHVARREEMRLRSRR